MKRHKELGMLFLFCMLMFPMSAAANNQGLNWAVEVGDRYDFSFSLFQTVEGSFPSSAEEIRIDNETVYIEVESLPAIPDNIQYWEELPSPEISLFYENNTEVSLSDSMVKYPRIGSFFIAPVGNWQFLASLPSNETTTTTTTTTATYEYESNRIDNTTHWGVSFSYSSEYTQYEGIDVRYKADGVLGYSSFNITNFEFYSEMISFSRLNPPEYVPPIIGIVEIGIIIGGAAAVTVIIITVMKRKT